jgi:hypothetical protein
VLWARSTGDAWCRSRYGGHGCSGSYVVRWGGQGGGHGEDVSTAKWRHGTNNKEEEMRVERRWLGGSSWERRLARCFIGVTPRVPRGAGHPRRPCPPSRLGGSNHQEKQEIRSHNDP